STVVDPFAFLHEYPDERAVEGRSDVLTFTGEPLDEPLDLAGPVNAHLHVSSDASSMQLHVKLIDVFPDGRALMLLRGQTTVATPGSEPVEAAVYLSHTGYRLEAGHRLRLHVASSDFPLYVPHPGTTESPWTATDTAPNRQTLHSGGAQASRVVVTII